MVSPEKSIQKARFVRAGHLDDAYRYDLAREAAGIVNRQRRVSHSDLQQMISSLKTLESGSEARDLAELAMIPLLASAGLIEEALQLFHRDSGPCANHGEIAFILAQAHIARKEPDGARVLLGTAMKLEKTRTGAALCLGDLEIRSGDPAKALHLYTEASARAPAWLLPIRRMRRCHEELGDTKSKQHLDALLKARESILSDLLSHQAADLKQEN